MIYIGKSFDFKLIKKWHVRCYEEAVLRKKKSKKLG